MGALPAVPLLPSKYLPSTFPLGFAISRPQTPTLVVPRAYKEIYGTFRGKKRERKHESPTVTMMRGNGVTVRGRNSNVNMEKLDVIDCVKEDG